MKISNLHDGNLYWFFLTFPRNVIPTNPFTTTTMYLEQTVYNRMLRLKFRDTEKGK